MWLRGRYFFLFFVVVVVVIVVVIVIIIIIIIIIIIVVIVIRHLISDQKKIDFSLCFVYKNQFSRRIPSPRT